MPKRVGIVTGAGALMIGGGIGLYFGVRERPAIDYCMSTCMQHCQTDLSCLKNCSPRDWPEACSTFLNVLQDKLYNAADGCMSPDTFDLIDHLDNTACSGEGTSLKRGEFTPVYESMIRQSVEDLALNSFCDNYYKYWPKEDLIFKSDEDILYFNSLEKCSDWSSDDFDK